MSDIADLAQLATDSLRTQSPESLAALDQGIRQVFLALHGNYGAQFSSKFALGQKDASGKDKGIRAAMLIWQNALSKFPPDVVQEGVRRCIEANPQFPPNLPQVEAHCLAAMPRKPAMPSEPRQALPPPDVRPVDFTPTGDRLDWARRILAREAAGHRLGGATVKMARDAMAGKRGAAA